MEEQDPQAPDTGGKGSKKKQLEGYSRKDRSLGVLCENFLSRYGTTINSVVNVDKAAEELGVERRRIYDIINVLEALNMMEKQQKNAYIWYGMEALPNALERLHMEAVREVESGLVDPNIDERKEKTLTRLTQRIVQMFLVSKAKAFCLDEAAKCLLPDVVEQTQYKTKVRRLYDIVNVLCALRLTQKTNLGEKSKPGFTWIGPNVTSVAFPQQAAVAAAAAAAAAAATAAAGGHGLALMPASADGLHVAPLLDLNMINLPIAGQQQQQDVQGTIPGNATETKAETSAEPNDEANNQRKRQRLSTPPKSTTETVPEATTARKGAADSDIKKVSPISAGANANDSSNNNNNTSSAADATLAQNAQMHGGLPLFLQMQHLAAAGANPADFSAMSMGMFAGLHPLGMASSGKPHKINPLKRFMELEQGGELPPVDPNAAAAAAAAADMTNPAVWAANWQHLMNPALANMYTPGYWQAQTAAMQGTAAAGGNDNDTGNGGEPTATLNAGSGDIVAATEGGGAGDGDVQQQQQQARSPVDATTGGTLGAAGGGGVSGPSAGPLNTASTAGTTAAGALPFPMPFAFPVAGGYLPGSDGAGATATGEGSTAGAGGLPPPMFAGFPAPPQGPPLPSGTTTAAAAAGGGGGGSGSDGAAAEDANAAAAYMHQVFTSYYSNYYNALLRQQNGEGPEDGAASASGPGQVPSDGNHNSGAALATGAFDPAAAAYAAALAAGQVALPADMQQQMQHFLQTAPLHMYGQDALQQ